MFLVLVVSYCILAI